MENKFTTPDIHGQNAKVELENKQYRSSIIEIDQAIKYSTDKVRYMLEKVRILKEIISIDNSYKKECKNFISSNLNLFYNKLSCESFIEVVSCYNECFEKYDSDIVDILKSKKIPYVLAYAYSEDKVVSTSEIIENARNLYNENKFIEALEHLKILETKDSMCRDSYILRSSILNSLQINNEDNKDDVLKLQENKEDIEEELDGKTSIIKKYITDNKKTLTIVTILLSVLFFIQIILFSTGIIPSKIYGLNLNVVSGIYDKIDDEEIAIPLNETIQFELDYKILPMYGNAGDIEYTIDDERIVSIDNDNKLTGLKLGSTNLNIISNGEKIYKFNIIVAQSSVTNISLEYSKQLNYIGDVSTIISNINRDYDFGEESTITYKSTDESVITVDEFGEIKAVGAGNAYIVVTCDDTIVEDNIIISNYVENIIVDSKITLEVGDTYKFNPEIVLRTKNENTPVIKYELLGLKDNNLNILELTEDGELKALKDGIQEVIIKCGNYKTKCEVTVNKKSIKNSIVKNIVVDSNIEGNNLKLDLSWENLYIGTEHTYKIYANLDGQDKEIDSLKVNSSTYDSSKSTLCKSINIDISDYNGKISIPIYITVSDNIDESKKSDVVIVDFTYQNPNNITNQVVVGLKDISQVNDDYIDVKVEWNNLDIGCKYNIYVKDNYKTSSKFELKGSIESQSGSYTSYSLGKYEEADLEVYIVAENKLGSSKQSDSIKIFFED